MNEASTYRIGFDVAKGAFQVHGVSNAAGEPVAIRRRLQRGAVEGFFAELPPSLICMEACGSAHYWARLAESYGHAVKLMPSLNRGVHRITQPRRAGIQPIRVNCEVAGGCSP